jgi:hypothetical protein
MAFVGVLIQRQEGRGWACGKRGAEATTFKAAHVFSLRERRASFPARASVEFSPKLCAVACPLICLPASLPVAVDMPTIPELVPLGGRALHKRPRTVRIDWVATSIAYPANPPSVGARGESLA